MTSAHIHLILVHVPIVGILLGALLLIYAVWAEKRDVVMASFGVLALAGLTAIPVYLTGEGAEEVVEELAGVTHSLIEAHEEAALFTLIAAIVVGVVALGGMIAFRRREVPRWMSYTTLVLALLASGSLGYTAYQGGQINHPEVRPAYDGTPAAGDEAHEAEDDD